MFSLLIRHGRKILHVSRSSEPSRSKVITICDACAIFAFAVLIMNRDHSALLRGIRASDGSNDVYRKIGLNVCKFYR